MEWGCRGVAVSLFLGDSLGIANQGLNKASAFGDACLVSFIFGARWWLCVAIMMGVCATGVDQRILMLLECGGVLIVIKCGHVVACV